MPVLHAKSKTEHGVDLEEPNGHFTKIQTVTENGKTFTRAWIGDSVVDIPPPTKNGAVAYKVEAPQHVKVRRF